MTPAPDHCQHCGVDLAPPKRGKPRSVPQNKRYFAMIKAAFSHWPESHRFKPMTEERLRKWLQARAGYASINTIETEGMTNAQCVAALAAAIMSADPVHFVSAKGSKLHVIQSRSIDFDTLPHLAACALFDTVADTIEAETGLNVDQIMPPTRERKPAKVETFSEVPL